MTGRNSLWIGVAFLMGAAVPFPSLAVAQAAHAGKSLRGDPSLYGEMKGPHAKTAAQVRQQTLVGQGLMPSFQNKLDDQELANLIAYIRKL